MIKEYPSVSRFICHIMVLYTCQVAILVQRPFAQLKPFKASATQCTYFRASIRLHCTMYCVFIAGVHFWARYEIEPSLSSKKNSESRTQPATFPRNPLYNYRPLANYVRSSPSYLVIAIRPVNSASNRITADSGKSMN